MPLCRNCQTIPFQNLPPFPNYAFSSAYRDKELAILFERYGRDSPQTDLGVLWHRSLNSLQESASAGCNLCALACAGAKAWIRRYEKETQRRYWVEMSHSNDRVLFNEGIWLAQRYGGGSGLAVLASIRETSMCGFTVLAGVGLSIEPPNIATMQPIVPMIPDSSAQATLDIARSWLEDCYGNHEGCPKAETCDLPSRVLEIGMHGDIIRLVDGTSAPRGKYATLSYCWGKDMTQVQTTRDTLDIHKAGISVSRLPKSLRDAVTISRHLGVYYLWIDSLCIIQDDKRDWSHESGCMTEVYSNAHVMIAANHASNCEQGCFHVRASLPSTKIHIPGHGEADAQLLKLEMEYKRHPDFAAQPLSMRGWALQERVLAKRIVHYNDDQMYYECKKGIAGENGSWLPFRYCNLQAVFETPGPDESKVLLRKEWYHIVSTYGRRQLTKPTDKLPALSGLAGNFSKKLAEPYIAGLWAGDLLASLAWQVPTSITPPGFDEYTGPSWSWAGFAGPTHVSERRGWTDITRVVDWRVSLRHEGSPFGELTAASLRIEAPLVKLRHSPVADAEHEARLARMDKVPLPRVVTEYSDKDYGHIVSMDYRVSDEIHKSKLWDMHLLLLGMAEWQQTVPPPRNDPRSGCEGNTETTFYGLVLVPADTAGLTMKRVGALVSRMAVRSVE